MQIITGTIVDFDQLAQAADERIVARVVFTCRSSKRRLVPKTCVGMANVCRTPRSLSIDLLDGNGKKEAEFRFAPIAGSVG